MKHDESILQSEIVQLLQLHRIEFFAVPNERKQSVQSAMRFKAMGVKSGVPDLVLMGKEGKGYGMEVKTPTGVQSPKQIQFQEKCFRLGWGYAVVRSLDDVLRVIRLWGFLDD